MLVAEEAIARKGVRGGQGDHYRDDGVDDDVDQGVDIAVVPSRVGEDFQIVLEGELLRPERERPQNLVGGFEGHADQPAGTECKAPAQASRACASLFLASGHHHIEDPRQQQDDQKVDDRHCRRRA
jgi:hypothetical protein